MREVIRVVWGPVAIVAAGSERVMRRLTLGPGNDRLQDWKPVRR